MEGYLPFIFLHKCRHGCADSIRILFKIIYLDALYTSRFETQNVKNFAITNGALNSPIDYMEVFYILPF